MNHLNEIISHSQKLPEPLQKKVLDFIFFLETRYSTKVKSKDSYGLSKEEIGQFCGILQAPRGISLEQMDEAIKKRGGSL